jgi:tetratricopeptide (TPR) repeat protein
LIAGRAIWFYARKLVFPPPLVFIYPRWEIGAQEWWQWLFPIAALVMIVALLLGQKRMGRGPAAAALLFVGALFPALGFVNVYPMRYSFVADHFQYHASAALIALLAAVLCRVAGNVSVVALLPLAILTAMRTPVYADAQTLWRDTSARNPKSWMVHTNLGHALLAEAERSGDERYLHEAEGEYLTALALATDVPETHLNAGMVYGRRRATTQALAHFDQALQYNPNFAEAYYGIGQVYQHQGDVDRAMANFRRALELKPNYPEANYRLAAALQQTGKLDEAIPHYRLAVGAMPEDRDARYDFAGALIALRNYDEAVYNLREAVRIDPNYAEAWLRLGFAQRELGRMNEAEHCFRTALRIKPELARQVLGR